MFTTSAVLIFSISVIEVVVALQKFVPQSEVREGAEEEALFIAARISIVPICPNKAFKRKKKPEELKMLVLTTLMILAEAKESPVVMVACPSCEAGLGLPAELLPVSAVVSTLFSTTASFSLEMVVLAKTSSSKVGVVSSTSVWAGWLSVVNSASLVFISFVVSESETASPVTISVGGGVSTGTAVSSIGAGVSVAGKTSSAKTGVKENASKVISTPARYFLFFKN